MNILSNSKNHNRLLKADKKKLVELFYIVKFIYLIQNSYNRTPGR